MNSVAAGFCADIDHGIADAFSFGKKNFFLLGDAESKSVDERILRIARLEADFAANRRDAKTISVTSDSANYAVEDAAVFRSVFFTGVFACSDLADRSESKTAMGRAPMVKMSRRMPPTPVVAPWKGST